MRMIEAILLTKLSVSALERFLRFSHSLPRLTRLDLFGCIACEGLPCVPRTLFSKGIDPRIWALLAPTFHSFTHNRYDRLK